MKFIGVAIALASAAPAMAGGLLTNTNQHAAFNRMMSREASIGIDGVYYNPAGVVFMGEGHHLALNWQLAYQTRTIDNSYPLFASNVNNNSTDRTFKGNAFAPVIPSIQYAYNKGRFSFQGNFALTGGGGKCTFDNGLGSFEKIVAETAIGASGLARAIDGVTNGVMAQYGLPATSTTFTDMFGSDGKYSFESYMHGRQYYYGLSLGAAYKMTDNLSVYAGVRGVYASCNYYGYVENIKVGNMPLYQVLDPTKEDAANIELSCDQSGLGFTPMLAADLRLGRFNFSAKYEFKTRIRLKNKSVNQAPSIGNLASNLSTAMVTAMTAKGLSPEQASAMTTAILGNETVTTAMTSIKTQFDTKLEEAIGEYEDGKKIAGDIPALLTVGAGYSPVDALRINVGFHWFDDKHATSYNDRNEKLTGGTYEYNAGVEFDACKLVTVSAGWQSTNYGLSDEYMDDKSFVVNSNSVACGGVLHLSDKMDLNLAYFHTFYGHKKTEAAQTLAGTAVGTYTADYTRNNNVFAVGLDINF